MEKLETGKLVEGFRDMLPKSGLKFKTKVAKLRAIRYLAGYGCLDRKSLTRQRHTKTLVVWFTDCNVRNDAKMILSRCAVYMSGGYVFKWDNEMENLKVTKGKPVDGGDNYMVNTVATFRHKSNDAAMFAKALKKAGYVVDAPGLGV